MIQFKPKISFLPWTSENVSANKSPRNLLRHARVGRGVTGFLAVDPNTKDLLGYAAWEGDFLVAFEVTEKYRGKGYGREFLRRAIQEGVTRLSVRKDNIKAQNLYEQAGFKETSRSGVMIFMDYGRNQINRKD